MSAHKRSVPWLGIALVIVFIAATVAISIPNLLRARISASESSHASRMRALAYDLIDSSDETSTQKDRRAGESDSNLQDRKIIHTAVLDLIVVSVDDAVLRIDGLVEKAGGYVEKSELLETRPGQQSAGLVLRVPQSDIGDIRNQIRQLAKRVESDKSEARDVTREFVDSEARLRNMKVEETQYLELMHRSGSTKDIIDITSRLSDVRGRIEQLTGELRYLSHQVEMSSITVTLATEYIPNDSLDWHPFRHARAAFHEMVESMTEYADFMVSFVLFVPVLLLWSITVIAGLILSWKILRWLWLRFIRRNPAPEPSTQP